MAGWCSVDADRLDAAGGYLDQALRVASIAGDPMLQADIWNSMAMRARQARAYTEAQAVARAGLQSTAARRNPRVRALFHARVAHGHAFRGEFGQANRSLGRAREALAKADHTAPTPPWLAFVNEAQIDALSAIAYNALGRYDLAKDSAQSSVSTEQPPEPGTPRRSARRTAPAHPTRASRLVRSAGLGSIVFGVSMIV